MVDDAPESREPVPPRRSPDMRTGHRESPDSDDLITDGREARRVLVPPSPKEERAHSARDERDRSPDAHGAD